MLSENARNNLQRNMIEQQIRPWNVLNENILTALSVVPRENFVALQYKHLSYMDVRIPLTSKLVADAQMLEPKLAARMIETLALQRQHRVLEVGSGSGYVSALLAALCEQVTSLEICPDLYQLAQNNVATCDNISLLNIDCFAYLEQQVAQKSAGARFDRIIINGASVTTDARFVALLNDNGSIVSVEGQAPAMQVVRIDSAGNKTSYFDTCISYLHGVEHVPAFNFN